MLSITLPRIAGPRCWDADDGYVCDRADKHQGRHAAIAAGGTVLHVWGRDVLRWRRIASRQRLAIARYSSQGGLATLRGGGAS